MALTEVEQAFSLPLPAEVAIGLFTPKGEEAWVPDWRPRYIWPETGETRQEMLFATGTDREPVHWVCLLWEPDVGHARYLKIMAPALAAFIDVRARPTSPEGCRVTVAYSYAPLSPDGEKTAADIDAEAHRAALAQWPRLLTAAGLLPPSTASLPAAPDAR